MIRRQPQDLPYADIGCGTGELAAMPARLDCPVQVVDLDYSPAMRRAAAGKIDQAGLHPRSGFVAADSEFLPFDGASFDIVTYSNSFQHDPHPQIAVNAVRRVLRTGGRFVPVDGFRDHLVAWVTFDVIVTYIEKGVYHAPGPAIDGYFRSARYRDVHRRKSISRRRCARTIGDVPKQATWSSEWGGRGLAILPRPWSYPEYDNPQGSQTVPPVWTRRLQQIRLYKVMSLLQKFLVNH